MSHKGAWLFCALILPNIPMGAGSFFQPQSDCIFQPESVIRFKFLLAFVSSRCFGFRFEGLAINRQLPIYEKPHPNHGMRLFDEWGRMAIGDQTTLCVFVLMFCC